MNPSLTTVPHPADVAGVVLDVELSTPLPTVSAHDGVGRRRGAAWLVVRLFTEPLGMVTVDLPDAGLGPAELLTAIVEACREPLAVRLAAFGFRIDALTTGGLTHTGTPPFVAARAAALVAAPEVTVVVCTREHPDALRDCLASLAAQELVRPLVVVVDNAPTTGRTREVVAEFGSRLDVHYTVERRPGLSNARNHALAFLAHEPGNRVVAWTDDDVRVDRFWVAEIARAFAERPGAVAVSGAVVPAELESRAQVWFEQFGGHSKGRGFTADEFGPGGSQSPYYPLPPFGVGANMAFRLAALRAIGGFDPALGAGTPAQGGEDTLAFTQLLSRDGLVLYRPAALVRHVHRPDLDGLRAQMRGYGAGLTAYYAALIRQDPRVLRHLLRLAPQAIRDLTSKDSARVATVQADFPRDLLAANRRGMLAGPWRYLHGRRR